MYACMCMYVCLCASLHVSGVSTMCLCTMGSDLSRSYCSATVSWKSSAVNSLYPAASAVCRPSFSLARNLRGGGGGGVVGQGNGCCVGWAVGYLMAARGQGEGMEGLGVMFVG